MENETTVWLVQPELAWENVETNLQLLEGMVHQAGNTQSEADLILLPETFSTGFTMESGKFAEEENGKTLSWMKRLASEIGAVVSGSVITRDGNHIYNRLHWVTPEGQHEYYDKRHLFRMGRENHHFSAGKERKIFHLGPFRFCPQICYDLPYPVFARNRNHHDVLFYVANWPATRHEVWETILSARAIENQSYVLGINRVGVDGVGVDHAGGSCVIDPYGKQILQMGRSQGVESITLSLDLVRSFREKFPAWKDADDFRLI